jgi:outer membrane protein OmpA-like peptidoglycan-associated protein
MLHAPTSDTQAETTQSESQLAPKLEQELHHGLHNASGMYSPGSLARAMPMHPPETQRQQKLALLQRTRGNQAVLQMLRSPQQIAHMPALRPSQAMTLQRKCACGGTPESEGECEECKAKREAGLQRRVADQGASPAVNTTPPIVHNVLSSPGQPLDAGTRAFMEPRFGHDFSQVRVHTDARAVESARAVNALAYTVGRNVVFGAGQYAQGTDEGRRLMAHELTHVVQQKVPLSKGLRMSHPEDIAEKEAEAIAQRMSQEKSLSSVQKIDDMGIQRIGLDLPHASATSSKNEISVRSQAPVTIARKSPTSESNLPSEEKSPTIVSSYHPEENVPQGGVETIKDEPNQQEYRVIGFDIGSSDLNKTGIKEGLDLIIEDLLAVNDAVPRVAITGSASESRLKGKDGFTYGWERANAIKKYFVDKGIPTTWITTNSLGSIRAPSAASPPLLKAYWRAATIEIKLTGKPRPPKEYRGEFAPSIPKPPKGPGLRFLIPPLSPTGAIRKTFTAALQTVKELGYANEAGKIEMFRNEYLSAYADAMADLTEADPMKRRLDYYKNQKRIDMGQLEGLRFSAIDDPKSLSLLIDAVKSTARRDALDWVISMEQSGYEQWAQALRDEFPDHAARRQELYKREDAIQ